MDEIHERQKARIDLLEERVRQLEEALMPSSIAVKVEWCLTPLEARVFSHLTTRDQASKQSIMLAMYSDRIDVEPEIKIVDVFVCKMRKKLKPFGIEILTLWGAGYSLKDRELYLGRAAA
ncbi:helix-turn-helix domain-containing protein [Rhizobium metallidurans]|uniref:Two-component system cell cycle response regulator CtrA n=1 Tax=Rhizobium metallidurans TaxID=1265931 RepID=A0A7W6CQY2_9HYPH|nr:helix-turn-helix domain-containing protein [Rhizobium metallidurans]MBB3963513.1 two-component system cell cycle response regulator CtrA [Rhizobium metallidurans]